ncbi:hypothetical protein [Streptomyces sp. NPDC059828]|uniref:hypothetical protein n=1 Tax=Streptomyces sp. NPDC059828 TaxID=3346965 RepID=UPI0036473841
MPESPAAAQPPRLNASVAKRRSKLAAVALAGLTTVTGGSTLLMGQPASAAPADAGTPQQIPVSLTGQGVRYEKSSHRAAGHVGSPGRNSGSGSDEDYREEVPCDPDALIEAVTEANNNGGGKLSLAEKCTYTLPADQGGSGLPQIFQPVIINGNGATITRAANADEFRIFHVGAGGNLKLRDLTLTRGKVESGDGGAINVDPAGRLTTSHVTLTDNIAANGGAVGNQGIADLRASDLGKNYAGGGGGAVFNANGRLTVTASRLNRNASGSGGGLNSAGGSVTISKSLIEHNTGSNGGGILSGSTLLDIDKSTIQHNPATGIGGGLAIVNGPAYLWRSSVSENTANQAGGIQGQGQLAIADSRVTGNSANLGGGTVVIVGDMTVRRSQINENQALTGFGGGVLNAPGSSLALTDVEVTRNIANAPAGGIHSSGTVTTNGRVRITDNAPTNCAPTSVPNCFG